jgi:SAM-dependent methyltransferase
MSHSLNDWKNNFEYQQEKKLNFEILSNYLDAPPNKLLDIGCGLAWESRLFAEKYDTNLWLIEGNGGNNTDNNNTTGYHTSTDTFDFYNPLDELKKDLDHFNTKNYILIDAKNINIEENIKFDLITSWLSCGFHYPLNTYKKLMLKHSHKNTKIIVNLRNVKNKLIIDEDVEIVNILHRRYDKKCVTAEIKFI